MNRGGSVIVLGVIVILGLGVVWLLSSDGGSGASSNDRTGDVVVSKGPKAPDEVALADLTKGAARLDGDNVVFEATVDDSVPRSLKREAVTLRWEISENDQVTWIVAASIDVARTASVIATQHDYRSSTVDESLPGELVVEGETVRVTLEKDDLEGFPSSFTWTLSSELDGDRGTSPSAVATDSIPNEGSLEVGS